MIPYGDRSIGSVQNRVDHCFDVVGGREGAHAVVRNDHVDVGAEQRQGGSERFRPGRATGGDCAHETSFPIVSGGQDDHDVATERTNEIDSSVDEALADEGGGVLGAPKRVPSPAAKTTAATTASALVSGDVGSAGMGVTRQ